MSTKLKKKCPEITEAANQIEGLGQIAMDPTSSARQVSAVNSIS